jgi:hypothetical protein
MFQTIMSKKKYTPVLTPQEIITLRSKQMSDFPWTPIAPTYPKFGGGYFSVSPKVGIPYSSTRGIGRTIERDISFYTFLTAVNNPLSRVYTEDLRNPDGEYYIKAGTPAGFYGLVCSEFLAYAYGLDIAPTSAHFPLLPEATLRPIQDAAVAQVGDFLHISGHVALVSEVVRVKGVVQYIVVTEASAPVVKKTIYTPSEFNKRLETYTLYKYNYSQDISFVPYEFPTSYNTCLGLDRGEKTNYIKSVDPVKYNVMSEDAVNLIIEKDGSIIENIEIESTGEIERLYSNTGKYKAYCKLTDDNYSEYVEFIVAEVSIVANKNSIEPGEIVRVAFSTDECEANYIMVRDAPHVYGYSNFLPRIITAEEKLNGYIDISLTATGNHVISLVGKNEFGSVYSNLLPLTVS